MAKPKYRVEWDPFHPDAEPGWFSASGGNLPQPVRIRVGLVRGRLRVIGVALDNGRPVTSNDLRALRLGDLLEACVEDYDPAGPHLAGEKFKYHESLTQDWTVLDIWLRSAPTVEQVDVTPARRGSAPSDDQLRQFASVYLEEQRDHPRRAMTLTTRRIPMARSTGYRWADLCRARGYLPREDIHE